MTTPIQIGLLMGLLAVAVIHTRSRIAGAMAATLWVFAALVWAVLRFQQQPTLRFLGIAVPPWIFYGSFAGLFVFNVAVIARAFRRRRAGLSASAPADTGPSRGAS